jgi:hypothetical protein
LSSAYESFEANLILFYELEGLRYATPPLREAIASTSKLPFSRKIFFINSALFLVYGLNF